MGEFLPPTAEQKIGYLEETIGYLETEIADRDTRLQHAADAIDKAMREAAAQDTILTDRELEIRLLRRERRLLVDLDIVKSNVIAGLLSGEVRQSHLGEIARLQAEVLKLHFEARSGVLLPEGVSCGCLLCAPKRDLRPEIKGRMPIFEGHTPDDRDAEIAALRNALERAIADDEDSPPGEFSLTAETLDAAAAALRWRERREPGPRNITGCPMVDKGASTCPACPPDNLCSLARAARAGLLHGSETWPEREEALQKLADLEAEPEKEN